jgi:hypothetical protein
VRESVFVSDDRGIKLRARATDGRILLESLIKISFEELVTDHLWRYGPVLAISNPRAKDKILPLGAARERAADASWQEKATDLMQQASMIVATAGGTQGPVWEIERIVSLGFRSKLVLLLPPVANKELEERWQSHAQPPPTKASGRHSLLHRKSRHLGARRSVVRHPDTTRGVG